MLQDWFGQGIGESYVDYFVQTKTAEFTEYHAEVSDWERAQVPDALLERQRRRPASASPGSAPHRWTDPDTSPAARDAVSGWRFRHVAETLCFGRTR